MNIRLGLRLPALRNGVRAPSLINRSQALVLSTRTIQTESLPPSAESNILNSQRLRRPSSPHFTIYQPQITWIGSIAHRVTGTGLSVLLYGFSLAYLTLPVFGISFDSGHIVEFVRELPEWAKYSAKAIVAFPFALHSLNGLRHLAWDSIKLMSNRAVARSGYAVLGASIVSTIVLVLM